VTSSSRLTSAAGSPTAEHGAAMARRTVVFSDLDGTLLNHHDYAWDAARPALQALRARRIPLVLSSSKTAAELVPLRHDMGLDDYPAIVENGGGILRPFKTRPSPTPTHTRLMRSLDGLPAGLRRLFSGFSSWSEQALQQHTGLAPELVELAARRDYSEPGLWLGDAVSKREFIELLGERGVRAQQGGRFLTLALDTSKAAQMKRIDTEFQSGESEPVFSIALGDAPNDAEMLQQADLGVIIPNPVHGGIPMLAGESEGHIIRASEVGSRGWNAIVLDLLEDPNLEAKG